MPDTFTSSTSCERLLNWEVPLPAPGAVKNLMNYYEERGDSVLRLLGQEERVPAFRLVADAGRVPHYE